MKADFKYIWHFKKLRLNITLAIMSIILSIININFIPLTALFIINFFDSLGYDFLIAKHWKYEYARPHELAAYRIMQKMFEVTVLIITFLLTGLKGALGLFLMQLFGVQDVIYHYFLEYKLPSTWTYPKTHPLVLIFKEVSNIVFVTFAILSCIVATILMFLV